MAKSYAIKSCKYYRKNSFLRTNIVDFYSKTTIPAQMTFFLFPYAWNVGKAYCYLSPLHKDIENGIAYKHEATKYKIC